MTVAAQRKAVVWAIYAWPGGRWNVVWWAFAPGEGAEHGPDQWTPTLEAARALVPAGFSREPPTPEDLRDAPSLVEFWR